MATTKSIEQEAVVQWPGTVAGSLDSSSGFWTMLGQASSMVQLVGVDAPLALAAGVHGPSSCRPRWRLAVAAHCLLELN